MKNVLCTNTHGNKTVNMNPTLVNYNLCNKSRNVGNYLILLYVNFHVGKNGNLSSGVRCTFSEKRFYNWPLFVAGSDTHNLAPALKYAKFMRTLNFNL